MLLQQLTEATFMPPKAAAFAIGKAWALTCSSCGGPGAPSILSDASWSLFIDARNSTFSCTIECGDHIDDAIQTEVHQTLQSNLPGFVLRKTRARTHLRSMSLTFTLKVDMANEDLNELGKMTERGVNTVTVEPFYPKVDVTTIGQ